MHTVFSSPMSLHKVSINTLRPSFRVWWGFPCACLTHGKMAKHSPMMGKKTNKPGKVPEDDAFIPPAAEAHLQSVTVVDVARSLTGTFRVFIVTRPFLDNDRSHLT